MGGSEGVLVSSSDLTYAEQEALNALRDSRLLTGSQFTPRSPLGLLFAERGAAFGIVAGLHGHERPQGMLLLLDPLDGRRSPTSQEESLLLTVAGQISVALENGQLAGAVRTMTAEKDELQRRAFYDPLTQIANRSLFTETVAKALTKLINTHRPVATLFIDLDGFKEVNDTYGHAVGDQVLNAVASRLHGQIRKMDMAARLGGDEFGLLLNGMRHRSDVYLVAERVVESLRRPIPVGGIVVSIGGSIGVAVVEHGSEVPTADEVLRRADMAMYLAKRQGKDRYIVFDNGAREPVITSETQSPSLNGAEQAPLPIAVEPQAPSPAAVPAVVSTTATV
jgi:diguanylate cyclase (GGDEF)-like protein